MAERAVIPPPPPGFVLDGIPPPPPGFMLDADPKWVPDSAPPAAPPPADTRSLAQRADAGLTGAVEAGASVVLGIPAQIAGRAVAIGKAFMPGNYGTQEGSARAQESGARVAEALTPQPRTEEGKSLLGSFARVVEASKLAGLGPSEAMALGNVAPVSRRAAAIERARQDVQQKLAAPKSAAITQAKEAGYVLPPAEANPNLLNRFLEGFSGQAKVQQLASQKNQPVTNQIARKALGISDDTPISVEVLEEVRRNAGKSGYEPVRKSGRVTADATYEAELDQIASKYSGAEKDFPKMASDEVRAAVDSAKVAEFDAGSGLDAIKIQRAKADKAFRAGDTELGKAHKAVAGAIEGQLERHLEESGAQSLEPFRQARQVIARSYDVQKALKGNDVDARVLAAQLRKGKPLGGGLEKAAEFGERFKGAAQTGGKNAYTPVSYFDAGYGGLAGVGALMHGPEMGLAAGAALGATALRPAIRAGLTSGPYQRLGVNPKSYGIGLHRRLSEALPDEAPSASAPLLLQGQQQ